MIHQAKSYLQFLVKSSNEHGVHSPFVFDLVTQCFYDLQRYPEYDIMKNYRKALEADNSTIKMTDFGAGSRRFKSDNRKISQIASTAGISSNRAELLFRIVKYFQPEQVLELGTSVGLATCALALGNHNGKVVSVEGCPETANVAKEYFNSCGISNVSQKVADFDEFLNTVTGKFDLIYFDGNHQKDATLRYFEKLLPTAHNDSVWIFDDIHWSPGMEEAWDQIKKHPQVTVTIDTFQWGFVFFRREQVREDFVIRV